MTIKRSTIICVIIVLLEIIAAVALFSLLPDKIPIHWNAFGEIDGYGGKASIFLMPGISAAVTLLLLLVPKIDPLGKNILRAEKAYSATLLSVISLLAVVFAVTVLAAFGIPLAADKIIFAAVGALLMIIGNYLPLAKRNYMFGIRTPWTLANDEVWMKTHRFGGVIFFIMGVLFIAACILNAPLNFIIPLAGTLIGIVWLFIYAYVTYKKTVKE